jgi:hypothetical protein
MLMQRMDNYHITSWRELKFLSPERDSPYLGFDCHHRMEMLSVMNLPCFSRGLSCFNLFPLELQKFLMLDFSLHVPLVMHLDLLSNLKILHKLDEGVEGWGRWLL